MFFIKRAPERRSASIRFCALMTALCLSSLAGCDRGNTKPNTDQSGANNGTPVDLPANLFQAAPPNDPQSVLDAKKTKGEGDAVVVRGRIGGGEDPFVEGRAIFTLADLSLPACSDNPDDKCPTPWDYCCESKDKVAANTVTVQLVGDDGKPLKKGLKNVSGLRPLGEVVVTGKIASRQGAACVIHATSLYVKPS